MNNGYSSGLDRGGGTAMFFKLLTIWRGSLYKLVYADLLAYLAVYYVINLIYRFALNPQQQNIFAQVVHFSEEVKGKIPFFFLLGFFVTGVIARWLKMYMLIPFLNRQAFIFQGFINGNDHEESLRIRKTVLRYLNLAWILLMRRISDQIALRFRKNNVNASISSEETDIRDIFINFNRDRKIQQTYGKIITDSEIRAFESIAVQSYKKTKRTYEPEYWIPIQWASRILQKSFLHNYVSDPRTTNKMIEELDDTRKNMQNLDIFCGIMIPLVYTQVVIIAVHSYFLCELLASQMISAQHNIPGKELDLYVPLFTIINYLFMMGWLKVAMCVMNPFGDDDEDFPTSAILDYNLETTFRSVTADLDMFPEKLDPAPMKYKCRFKIDPPDNLEEFLNQMDYDLEDIDKEIEFSEVKALEIKESIWKRMKTRLFCQNSLEQSDYELSRKRENRSSVISRYSMPDNDEPHLVFDENSGIDKPESQKNEII